MILVVSDRPWVAAAFAEWRPTIGHLPMATSLVTTYGALTVSAAHSKPDVVIFPHWSYLIPPAIYDVVPCIGFHLGDLPRGRGGSPLQNLLVRGLYRTTLCAFRITGEMDGGPVYLRELVDLSEGSAEAIYHDLARRCLRMAETILNEHIEPQPQVGTPPVWKRRTPNESAIPKNLSPIELYDFIRMLDAPGYPYAFLEAAGQRVTFTNARRTPGGVVADAALSAS